MLSKEQQLLFFPTNIWRTKVLQGEPHKLSHRNLPFCGTWGTECGGGILCFIIASWSWISNEHVAPYCVSRMHLIREGGVPKKRLFWKYQNFNGGWRHFFVLFCNSNLLASGTRFFIVVLLNNLVVSMISSFCVNWVYIWSLWEPKTTWDSLSGSPCILPKGKERS
jgi:hypothetical protein